MDKIKQRGKRLYKKYGLTLQEYAKLLRYQGGRCAVCRKLPKKYQLAVDHEHCSKYCQMPAESKLRQVRGLLCAYCNRYLVAKNTAITAKGVWTYLADYEYRRLLNNRNRCNN